MSRFKNPEVEISPTGLLMPASYSRLDGQAVPLGKLLTSRFVRAALDLGLLITRPQEKLPLSHELTKNQLKAVTLASMEMVPQNEDLNIGADSYSPEQMQDEVRKGTVFGNQLMTSHRILITMYEHAAVSGKLKLVPDPDPNAPEEPFKFPY